MTNEIIIFGTGEIAELAFYYFMNDSKYKVVAFTADDEYIRTDKFLGLPLVSIDTLKNNYPPNKYKAHVALSYSRLNQTRKKKYEELKKLGYELVSYVCTKSFVWPDLTYGDNCFILENQTIQPTVTIGSNVMIWSGNHLGHACTIESHSYISSHVCISGHVKVGESCFLGVNSTIRDYVKLGNRVFVGMDSSIVRDAPDDSVVLGTPATVYNIDDRIAQKVRKRYFGI